MLLKKNFVALFKLSAETLTNCIRCLKLYPNLLSLRLHNTLSKALNNPFVLLCLEVYYVFRTKKLQNEEIIIIAIVILIVIGFVLIFAGLKTSVIGGKEQQSKEIKQEILQSLETVEKNLDDVGKILDTPS